MNRSNVVIRAGGGGDIDWALGLAPEMARFGLPPWRDFDLFVEQCRESLRGALQAPDPENLVLVAVNDDGSGSVWLTCSPPVLSG
jgi:hypothetical protein